MIASVGKKTLLLDTLSLYSFAAAAVWMTDSDNFPEKVATASFYLPPSPLSCALVTVCLESINHNGAFTTGFSSVGHFCFHLYLNNTGGNISGPMSGETRGHF